MGILRIVVPTILIALLTTTRAESQVANPTTSTGTPSWRDGHTPRKALIRAAVVPGWGQLYNRQYAKAPVVYVVLGGLTANTIRLNRKYLLYRHAYQYKAYEEITPEGEENPRAEFEADYNELVSKLGGIAVSSSSIRPSRDTLRRNRDLSVVGIGVAYGLSLLDAYVSAHLLDFDVGENLLVSVSPVHQGVRTSLTLTL